MERRTYLGALGVAGVTAVSGCLGLLDDDGAENAVLPTQDEFLGDPEDYSYPAYGERLPAFELPDPIAGETVDVTALERTAVVTTFFAACPAECGILIDNLAGAHAATVERDRHDEVVFLAITFDPERDDAERLRENAAVHGIDLDAGNWHYLRPETPEEARTVVTDQLGIPFERTEESERLPSYDFSHTVVTVLANPGGVVERAFQGEHFDRERLVDDAVEIADGYDPDEHGV